ncbi:MAG: aminotransferase class V-fold PLP-dependent enzyme [Gemmatimonadetes bacterium]|nr:aminotransferase class V-fold PLP-dependent enzyme [Gemmatimonadota bacterium]
MRQASAALTVRLATEADLDDIRQLNHQTFAGEIPQHAPRPDGRLVDRFEGVSTFIVVRDGDRLVGMCALRTERPFSLDAKLPDLDRHLPPGRTPCEIRLLAVEPEYRHGVVLRALLTRLVEEAVTRGFDTGVISATTRQLKLYTHMGFVPFGPLVGTEEAAYQPMYVTKESAVAHAGSFLGLTSERRAEPASFLTGPVPLSPEVRARVVSPLRSHRSPSFAEDLAQIRRSLAALIDARHVAIFAGSGTLANDAIAAQIARDGAPAVVCSNGELGERLLDHARRHGIDHEAVRVPWGSPLPMDRVVKAARRVRAGWIWMVHHETSTGMLNSVNALRDAGQAVGARLALDAASSVGTVPMSLRGVALASAVSGKALGAVAGLSLVCCDEPPMPGDDSLPRYLDLARYLDGDGVPYTQSSLLVGALATAVSSTDWPARYAAIARADRVLRERMEAGGHLPLVRGPDASPAVATWQAGSARDTSELAARLLNAGFALSWESGYLRARQWMQTAFMGAFEEDAVAPMAEHLARVLSKSLAS